MKKMYEKPVVYIVQCLNEKSFLSLSGTHPNLDENDDTWSDDNNNANNGGTAKEAFFGDESEGWGEFYFEN